MRSAGLSVAVWLCATSSAYAQRVIFPTQVQAPIAAQPAPLYTTQAPGSMFGATPTSQPTLPAFDPYSYPAAQPPAFNPYGGTPYYSQPGYTGVPPGGLAYPNAATGTPNNPSTFNDGVVPQAIRLMQDIRFQWDWMPRNSAGGFGMNDFETSVSFGIPVSPNIPQPVLITPGFNFHLWNGPDSLPNYVNDMPARAYDAYLMTSWRPQFTPMFGADLAVSVGVYSDFAYTNSQSIRVLGRGLGLVTINPKWQAALGVWYLDRLRVKILPAGGLIWVPNPDARFELVFPNPKLSQRIATYGNTDYWGYIAGEYGGGQWTILHANGDADVANYNDLRLIFGVEFVNQPGWRGNLEIAYVFNREILFGTLGNLYEPPDTMMLRGQLRY